jgi:hypothetical protein
MNAPGRILRRVGLPALLFVLAGAGTLLLIQRTRRYQANAVPLHVEALDNTPGLAEGELVSWPRLPNLSNQYVELNSVKQKYLLFAFISAECAHCAQDQPFWKDLIKETAPSVAFYVISIDDDQSKVEKYARAYQFDDLPVLFDPEHKALATFNIRFVPEYILLTPEGKVLGRWNGLRRYDPKQTKAIDRLEGLRGRI